MTMPIFKNTSLPYLILDFCLEQAITEGKEIVKKKNRIQNL